jgi:NTE family protein
MGLACPSLWRSPLRQVFRRGSPAKIRPPKGSIAPWQEPTTLTGPAFTKKLVLTDGGVYDNLGIEPVWKRYRTLLVSDGGAVTRPLSRPATNW